MVGIGLYGGGGIAPYFGHTDGPMTSSNGSWTPYGEADIGWGPALSLGGGVDKAGNWGVNGGAPYGILKRIPGVGIGVAGGVGLSYSLAGTTPSLGDMFPGLRDAGKNVKPCK